MTFVKASALVWPAPVPVLCHCFIANAIACACAGAFRTNTICGGLNWSTVHVPCRSHFTRTCGGLLSQELSCFTSVVDLYLQVQYTCVAHLWWTCIYRYSTLVSHICGGLVLQAQYTCVSYSHLRWTSSEKQNALVFIFGEIESQFEHCLECCKKLL